ncbi:MAG: NAD-binding protein [Planctomycetota bacterium]
MPVTASESATGPIVRLVTGVIAFALICAAGASAYRYFGWTWGDGIYMVIITIFTVGYAEVRPVESPELRSVTMAVIVFGYAATLLIVSGLAQLVLDGELRHNLEMRRMIRNIESLRGHIIICGYGRMGRRLASKLRGRRDILVIDLDEDKLAEAAEDGFMVLRGNASEEDLLRAAGIEYASVLVAVIPDDATCLFTTITARGLNRELKILSRGEQPSTVQKLRQVGADHVVLTAAIGADRLCQLILRPTAAAMLRNDELPSGLIEDLESIGLAMDELTFKSQSSLCGRTLAELTVRGKNSFLIVALRRCDGTMMVNPSVETKVEAGDTVMVLGHEGDIHTLCHQFQLHRNEELVAERSAEPLEPTVVEETASPTTDADDVTESATHQTTTSTAESTLSANSRGQA